MPVETDNAIAEPLRKVQLNKECYVQPRLLLVSTVAVTVRSFLLPIARHFQNKGWHVDAMANGISADQISQANFDHVWEADWSRNPAHLGNFEMVSRMRTIVRTGNYDIVHVHTPVAGFVTRLALDPLRHDQKLQVIYTAHGFHSHPRGGTLRNRVFEVLERNAAQRTDFLVVINREDLAAAKAKGIIQPDRVRYMPGIGVDRSHYSAASVSCDELDRLHAELGISNSDPILLMLAEFTANKRHADVIRAFSKISHPRAHLLLAGTGPLFEPMKKLAARLGVAPRVHFLGLRKDVPAVIKASRAVLLPSGREGLPRCALEALSMGVPVIGTRIRGTSELLEEGAGLLVEVGDVEQLAGAMQLMIDDPSLARSMGEAGRRRSETYDQTHVLRLHEALYDEALELRRS